MVWAGGSQVGCGIGQGRRLAGDYEHPDKAWVCQVIVCRYTPYGNYNGDAAYLANVLPAVPS